MSKIHSRKHNYTAQLLMLAASLPVVSAQAQAADQDVAAENNTLPKITLKATPTQPAYKTDKVSSAKYTQPLVDTPQTISVIKKEIIKDQGATSLVEALRNTPGITLQLGENGNTSAGDTFQMRGFSTQTSTFVDGIRDLGAVSRDVFNIEQIEVVKGPSGSESGRGAASGYINLVSKLPKEKNEREVSLNWNTANHKRLTADINQVLADGVAARLNVMGQEGGIEGRDYIENNGFAIAPSIAFGLGSDTRFYAYSQHVRQRNIPDGGISSIGFRGFYNNNTDSALSTDYKNKINTAVNHNPQKVDRENFYGNVNDHEDVDADMVSFKVEHDFNDKVSIQNITRYGETSMERALTGVNTILVDENNPSNRDAWTISRSYQGVDQENKILANQTNVNFAFNTGPVQHKLVTGLEFIKEEQHINTLATQAPGLKNIAIPANLYNPNRNDVFPRLTPNGAYSDGETTTIAAYVFDTVDVTDFLQLSAGIRADRYKTQFDSLTLTTNQTTGGTTTPNPASITRTELDLEAEDTLISWKLGALVKPTSNSSVYASFAKSLTPPGSSNFGLSSDPTNANNTAAKPQETNNYEIGTKWDVLKGKLALAAAVYRSDNENQFTQDPVTATFSQEGKTRVEGVELSAVGKITDAWDVSAGIARMKTEQLDQVSVNATSKVVTTTDAVRWSPDLTASLWSTYSVGGFKVGAGARYVSEQKRVINDAAGPANMPEIEAYWVFDALASYTYKQASVNLNIYNLLDKEYISTLNNGGSRLIMGQPRSAALTLNYKF